MTPPPLSQREAYDWLRSASIGARVPNDQRLEFVAAMAVRELIWRHEKLCEAVMGILTDNPPDVIGMTNEQYRQLLREQVSMALTGFQP